MRTLLDALNPNNIPLSAVTPDMLIAAYVGHSDNPESYAQAVARFPNNQIVSIAAQTHWDAQILDVEHQAVEPDDYATMNDWCSRQLARGVFPTIYCNTSTWPSVYPNLVHKPNWWAAKWDGHPIIPTTPYVAVGIQYGGIAGYDISVLLDYIEGIDSVTQPFTPVQLAQIRGACVDAVNAAILPTTQELYVGPPTDLSQEAYQATAGAGLWAAYQANIGDAAALAAYQNGYNAWVAWALAAAQRWNLQSIGKALAALTIPVAPDGGPQTYTASGDIILTPTGGAPTT